MLARGGGHQQPQAGPCDLGVPAFDDGQRVGNIGATPSSARVGHLKIPAWCGLAPRQLDTGGFHVEAAACLVFGQYPGDVIVDHHHFVCMAGKLPGKNANRRRATTHAHALFGNAIDDGRAPGLDDELGAAINGHLHRLLVAQQLHHLGGNPPLFLAAAGEVVHATQRQHLGAVFRRGHMPHHLALAAHIGLLGTQETVGVNFDLEAAVTEDAFGDDSDHVHTLHTRPDDEWRGFVVRIGGR